MVQVFIDGRRAELLGAPTDGAIQCKAPPGRGSAVVHVVTAGGIAQLDDALTYMPPRIHRADPPRGLPGTRTTLHVEYVDNADVFGVVIGGKYCPNLNIGPTKIECRLAPDAAPGVSDIDIIYKATDKPNTKLVKGYTVIGIAGIRPPSGIPGALVTVDMPGMNTDQVSQVWLGAFVDTVTKLKDKISFPVPEVPQGSYDVIVYGPKQEIGRLPKAFTVTSRIVKVEPNTGKPARLEDIVIHTRGLNWLPGPDRIRVVEICGARTSSIGYGKDTITTVFWADRGRPVPGPGDVVLFTDQACTKELARLTNGFTNTAPQQPGIIDIRPNKGPVGTPFTLRSHGMAADVTQVYLSTQYGCVDVKRVADVFTGKIPDAPKGTYTVNLYRPGPTYPSASLQDGFIIT